jgi:hypothetical protein
MAQAIIFLEAGILAVCFGIALTRRGYIGAHKRPYFSSSGRMHLGVVLVLVGIGCIVAGLIML